MEYIQSDKYCLLQKRFCKRSEWYLFLNEIVLEKIDNPRSFSRVTSTLTDLLTAASLLKIKCQSIRFLAKFITVSKDVTISHISKVFLTFY